jgi:hypothetical protein
MKKNLLGDGRQSNAGVRDLVDLSSSTRRGLNANTVDGLGDLGVGEGDCVNGVVVATTDRADRETVATRTETVLEGYFLVTTLVELANISDKVELTVPEFTATQSSWL